MRSDCSFHNHSSALTKLTRPRPAQKAKLAMALLRQHRGKETNSCATLQRQGKIRLKATDSNTPRETRR